MLAAPAELSGNAFTSHLPRREVSPEEQGMAPYSGVLKLIGRYDRRDGRPAELDCSAPVISDHLIVANLHCLVGDGRLVPRLSAFVGFRGNRYQLEFVPSLLWRGAGSQPGGADDLALLGVSEAFPSTIGRFAPETAATARLSDAFEFIGYSRDVANGRVLTHAERCYNHPELKGAFPGLIAVECDFVQNASSAPLFLRLSGRETTYRLVAIVEGGVSRYSRAVPFSAKTANIAIPANRFAPVAADLERAIVMGRAPTPIATFASIRD
jgi:hypothetical protein